MRTFCLGKSRIFKVQQLYVCTEMKISHSILVRDLCGTDVCIVSLAIDF